MNAPARFAAALAVGMCFVASDAGAQTLKKIADTNKITVSYREAAIPFSYTLDSGKPVGFSVDLTQAIVASVRKELNRPSLDVAYLLVTGQNRIPLLVDGTYDLECGSTTNTVARSNEVAFTVSHFFAGTRLLVKKSSNVKDYADLTGKMVATTAGSTNDKVIRKYSDEKKLDMQFVSGADYAAAFQLVEDNKAVAFALDDILLYGLRANSANPASLDIVGSALQVEPYGCMVRKGDPEFKKLVDDTIADLMKSGEFAKMYSKWFEAPIPPKGVVLNMPMSSQLKANLTALSDQPAL
jgi:glutamate/aspartate transport system substrate-binding protein